MQIINNHFFPFVGVWIDLIYLNNRSAIYVSQKSETSFSDSELLIFNIFEII